MMSFQTRLPCRLMLSVIFFVAWTASQVLSPSPSMSTSTTIKCPSNFQSSCAVGQTPTATYNGVSAGKCSAACNTYAGCAWFNHVADEIQPADVSVKLGECQLLTTEPTNVTLVSRCAYFQRNDPGLSKYGPFVPTESCSLPFTYGGRLYISGCAVDVTDSSNICAPYVCLLPNATVAKCYPTDYVAQYVDATVIINSVNFLLRSVNNWIVFAERVQNVTYFPPANTNFEFNLTWNEYKAGFVTFRGSYWLGLEKAHQLTSANNYRLRVEMLKRKTQMWYSAEYWLFKIDSESQSYRLRVYGHSGDVGDGLEYTGPTPSNLTANQHGMYFATPDRYPSASNYTGTAVTNACGWWFNIGGTGTGMTMASAMFWFPLSTTSPTTRLVDQMRMMIKIQ